MFLYFLADFCIFYANISSFSPQAKGYIYELPKEVKALALVELHKPEELEVVSNFKQHKYTVSYNIPEASDGGGNHGGEALAVRQHIHSTPIQPDILSSIALHFSVSRRFSARIVRFKKLSVVFITIYLWC